MSLMPFFEKKLADTLTHRVYNSATDSYGYPPSSHLFKFLITQVDSKTNRIQCSITCYSITPSGIKDGDSDRQFGSKWILVKDSIEETFDTIIKSMGYKTYHR